jgi:hypothetical protein
MESTVERPNEKQPQLTHRLLQTQQLPEIIEELEELTLDPKHQTEQAETTPDNSTRSMSVQEGPLAFIPRDQTTNRKVSDFLSTDEKDIKADLEDPEVFKFEVGNTVDRMTKLNVSQARRVSRRRVWQFFVEAKGRCDLRHFIDKVVIELGSKGETRKSVLTHPFEFSASAELEEIPYSIVWREWTRLPPTKGVHPLSLSKNGASEILTIQYSAKAFEEHKRRSLKECMR